MKKYRKILYFGNLNDEIHYLLCFIGGSIEAVAFILLFKSLIGFMTANTLFGLTEFMNGDFGFASVFKLLTILIFIIIVFIHQLYVHIRIKKGNYKPNHVSDNILIKSVFFFLFFIFAHILYINGFLKEPNLISLIVMTLGLVVIYTQNYVIKSGHPIPTPTLILTGNYMLLVSSLSALVLSNENRKQKKEAAIHHIFVMIHFICGVIVMIFLTRKFDFLSLGLPFILLIYLYFRTKGRRI